jgi:hypothetical protein
MINKEMLICIAIVIVWACLWAAYLPKQTPNRAPASPPRVLARSDMMIFRRCEEHGYACLCWHDGYAFNTNQNGECALAGRP